MQNIQLTDLQLKGIERLRDYAMDDTQDHARILPLLNAFHDDNLEEFKRQCKLVIPFYAVCYVGIESIEEWMVSQS